MNSRAFWEQYFEDEWGVRDGPSQSRHFMLQLLSHLPLPELHWLLESNASILDWGCATGEGTGILARLLLNSQVTGVDFAQLAIDEASHRHPGATFLWTPEGEIPHDFDVVLSSNCLEHFEDPLAIATDHVRHCRTLYIILVPYKEHPLHEQHFAQFRDESFPDTIGGFSRLEVVPFPVNNDHWPGWQVLALYGAASYLEGRTRPEDLPISLSATRAALGELTLITNDIAGLSTELRANKRATADFSSRLEATESELEATESKLEATESKLETTGRKLETTVAALEAAEAELSDEQHEREGLATALRKSSEERDQREERIQQLEGELASVADQLGSSTRLLIREEARVLRPLARRVWRSGRAVGRQLPPAWQDTVRAYLAPVAKGIAPNSAQAMAYQIRASASRRGFATFTGPAVTESCGT